MVNTAQCECVKHGLPAHGASGRSLSQCRATQRTRIEDQRAKGEPALRNGSQIVAVRAERAVVMRCDDKSRQNSICIRARIYIMHTKRPLPTLDLSLLEISADAKRVIKDNYYIHIMILVLYLCKLSLQSMNESCYTL